MHIDEDMNIIKGSDHNLITVDIKINDKNRLKKAKWKIETYQTTKEPEIKKCITELGDTWENTEDASMDKRIEDIIKTTEKT